MSSSIDVDILNYLPKKGADPLIKNYDNLNLRDIATLEHDTKIQAILDKDIHIKEFLWLNLNG